jgi:hypothetical protein
MISWGSRFLSAGFIIIMINRYNIFQEGFPNHTYAGIRLWRGTETVFPKTVENTILPTRKSSTIQTPGFHRESHSCFTSPGTDFTLQLFGDVKELIHGRII